MTDHISRPNSSNIAFSASRWELVREHAGRWWRGELDRPLIQLTCANRDPGRPKPSLPDAGYDGDYPFSTPPEDIVDRWEYDLSCQTFLGDAFPHAWPNFGSGVAAAFLGAKTEIGRNSIWFHPDQHRAIQDLTFENRYNPANPWLRRVKEIYMAAKARFREDVQLGMTDLGGSLDIVSTFRPGEELLMDLYDYPEHVKRATWEAHHMWWRFYEELKDLITPPNRGHTAWTSLYSDAPYYMLQCDFSYMIGPAMFDEFVKPELAATCRRLSHAFYHLDGVGQIPHLGNLLSIPELKGIQWIQGDGKPPTEEWIELYREIQNAGKRIQIFTGQSKLGYRVLDVLAEKLGTTNGIAIIGSVAPGEIDEARRFLDRYGANHN